MQFAGRFNLTAAPETDCRAMPSDQGRVPGACQGTGSRGSGSNGRRRARFHRPGRDFSKRLDGSSTSRK
jgi:hypothetical protein